MSEKRIQRKHFLAALGTAVAGLLGAGSLSFRRVVRGSGETVSQAGRPVPATDPRSVARSARG